jgi:hypothetical protein
LLFIIVRPSNISQAAPLQRITLNTTELQAEEAPTKLPFKLPFLKRAKAVIAEGRFFSAVKRRLKPLFVTAGKAALRRPWVKRSVLAVLNRSPKLKNRLYRLVWKDIALAPRAMRIYTALSTTIPTHRTTHSKGNE